MSTTGAKIYETWEDKQVSAHDKREERKRKKEKKRKKEGEKKRKWETKRQ
jgi:hypothetical protein